MAQLHPLLGEVTYLIVGCALTVKIVPSFGINSCRSFAGYYTYAAGLLLLYVLSLPFSFMAFLSQGEFMKLLGLLASGLAMLYGLARLRQRLLALGLSENFEDTAFPDASTRP